MKQLFLTGIALVAMPLAASAQMAPAPAPDASTEASGSVGMAKLSLQDTHFMKIAAIGGMAEVNDGKIAEAKGGAAVQPVANRMVTDHTKVNAQLMSLARQKGVVLPAQVDPKHAAISAKLETLSGAAFDRYYLATQLRSHEMAIAAFKAQAGTGSDPDLKAFANANLPTLQMHLSMIQAAMK